MVNNTYTSYLAVDINFSELSDSDNHKKFYLIGKGNRGDCGTLFPLSCPVCFELYFSRKKCGLKSCPDCYTDWMVNATREISTRLLRISDKARNKRMKLRHVIVSPDPSLYDYPIEVLRRDAIDYFNKKAKYLGGAVIFHAYRPNNRFWKEYGEEIKDDDIDIKKWEWIREKTNWQDYVEYNPHFHFIVWTRWTDHPEKGEKWIYKTIMKKGRVKDFGNKKEAYNLIYYILSHTVYKEDGYFNSYSYIGDLSARRGKKFFAGMKVITSKKPVCKNCRQKLIGLDQNLHSWFKNWMGISNYKDHDIKSLKKTVLYSKINKDIMLNILKQLDYLETNKPPPDNIIEPDWIIEQFIEYEPINISSAYRRRQKFELF